MLVRIRPEAELSAAEREFVDCLRALRTTCLTLVDVRVDRGSRRVDAVLITPRGITVAEVRGFQRRQSGILSVRGPWKISGEPVDLDDESSPSEQLEHGVYAVRTTLERALLDPGHVCGFVALLPYRGVVVRPARTNLRPGLDVVVANATDTAEFRSYIEKFGDEPTVWDVDRVLGAVDALDMGEGLSRADLRDDGFDDRNPGGREPRRRTPNPAAVAPSSSDPEPAVPSGAEPAVPMPMPIPSASSLSDSSADDATLETEPERTASGAIPMPAPPGAMPTAAPMPPSPHSGPATASRLSDSTAVEAEPAPRAPAAAGAIPMPAAPVSPRASASGPASGAPPEDVSAAVDPREHARQVSSPADSATAPEPGLSPDSTQPPVYVPPPTPGAPPPPPPGGTTAVAAPPPPPPGSWPTPVAAPPPPPPGSGPTGASAPPPPGFEDASADPTPTGPGTTTPRPGRLNPLPPESLAPPFAAQQPPAPSPQSRLRSSLAWVVLAVAGLGLLAVLVVIVTAQTTDDGVSEPGTSSTRIPGTVTVEPTTTPPGPNACFPFQTDC